MSTIWGYIHFKAIKKLMHQEKLDETRPRIGYKIGKGK